MNIFHAVFVYTALVNVCVIARGGGHGGGHGGHGGGHGGYGSHGSHGTHGGHTGHAYGSYHVSAGHTHYAYHPPRQLTYSCRFCSGAGTYPVYRHPLPTYVYVYKDSDSRYNQLFTGLSLYNLGRTAEGGHHPNLHYSAQPQEKCSMQIIERSHFEETEFPCFMISSFITSTPTNQTKSVDITSSNIDVKAYLGTSGAPLEVTPDQVCVLWHNLTTYQVRSHHVPCALLKEYANTVKPIGVPVYVWLPTLLGAIILIYVCCQCCRKKKDESVKEVAPLNDVPVAVYSGNNY